MPPKGAQQQPHRGTRAGYKSRKKTFYEAQDIVQQATYDTFGVWLSKRTYDRLTQQEVDLVCEFILLDERPIEHEIWDRIGRFYREVSAAIGRARRGAEEAARAPESGEGAAAASSEPSAPSKAAAPKQQPKPLATKPKAAPKLGISGPTKDLYFPSRRDPLRERRAPEEEREEEDTSGRPASEPRQRHRSRSVDLGAAGGAPRAESLTRSRRVRTPPRRRAQESRNVQELRLRGNLFAALAAEDSDVEVEVEVDEPAPKTADDPEQEEEQEQEAEPPAPEGAAFGAPGENAEGAEEEEAPEADVEVSPSPSEATREVRVGVKRGSVTRRPLILAPATEAFPTVRVDSQGAWVRVREPPSQPSFVRRAPPPPRVQREAHQGDEEEALSAPDPYDLPDDAWLEPRAFRESHTSRGFPRGVTVHSLSDSGEEAAGQGAAPGAPAQPRAPPAKRPFERGEVVEAEAHPPPLQRRRPQEAQQEQRRVILRPAAKGAAPATKSVPLRVPKPAVLPERSRPQRVVPEAVDGELEGEARQARTRTRSPKPKVTTASSPPPRTHSS